MVVLVTSRITETTYLIRRNLREEGLSLTHNRRAQFLMVDMDRRQEHEVARHMQALSQSKEKSMLVLCPFCFLFSPRLQLIEWYPKPLGGSSCFTQISPEVLVQTLPEVCFLGDFNFVKMTFNINYHKSTPC